VTVWPSSPIVDVDGISARGTRRAIRRRLFASAVMLAAMVAAAAPATGQETRREQVERARAARARELEPYRPGRIEAGLLFVERNRLIERFAGDAEGWYPLIGSVTRGGGFAMGAGYRRSVAHERLLFNVNAAGSLRSYRTARVELRAPRFFNDRLEIGGRFRHRYFPQEDYYGLGPESSLDDRVNYLLEENEFAGFATVRPVSWFAVSGQVAYLTPDIRPGTDTRYASIEERFTEATAPGIAQQPGFVESGVLLDADYRDQPGNPRSGGRYALLFVRYDDRGNGHYDFTRLTTLIEHNVPIFDKKRVFAVRLTTNHADAQDGAVIPFYYLPSLGGRDSVRAYNDFRFRDTNSLVVNAEYRWEAFAGMDMALFYDVGNAKPSWRAMSIRDMRSSYGVAFRFNTYQAVFLRAEVAFGGDEGSKAFLGFGGPLRFERFIR
jgi:hypothetical protein